MYVILNRSVTLIFFYCAANPVSPVVQALHTPQMIWASSCSCGSTAAAFCHSYVHIGYVILHAEKTWFIHPTTHSYSLFVLLCIAQCPQLLGSYAVNVSIMAVELEKTQQGLLLSASVMRHGADGHDCYVYIATACSPQGNTRWLYFTVLHLGSSCYPGRMWCAEKTHTPCSPFDHMAYSHNAQPRGVKLSHGCYLCIILVCRLGMLC